MDLQPLLLKLQSKGFVRAILLALWCCVAASAFGEVAIGNLVFVDANGNGVADAGEGRAGVTVKLFQEGQSPSEASPMRQVETDENGFFLFENLVSAWPYFLHVPPAEFNSDGALKGLKSLPSVDGRPGADDHLGEDGTDAADAADTGVSSRVVTVVQGSAAVNEPGLGGNMDDGRDAAVDLTVDFGFYRPMAVGNLVFLDANGNGRADPGEGVNGVQVRLYRAGKTPGVDAPENETVTGADGRYLLDDAFPNANYFLHVPAAEFAPGKPLAGALGVTGADAVVADDDAGEDGLDAGTPAVNGVSTAVFTLPGEDGAPTGAAGETGFLATADDLEDGRVDLTRDFGFLPAAGTVGVGNLVYVDENGDGSAQSGEGRDGVIVRLFTAGSDPTADAPLAEAITVGGGRYYFGNLSAGSYFVFVPASQFAADGILERCVPLPSVAADADDDAGQNALSAATPDQTGVRTGNFTLALGSAPTQAAFETGIGSAEDDAQDADVDLTVDLGFLHSMSVGNLVFVDANGNGKADAAEGRDGVTVQLFREGDDPAVVSPRAEVVTADEGRFLFSSVSPGRYFLRMPPTQFQSGAALDEMISISGAGGDNGVDDDDNGLDVPSPAVTGLQSMVFELEVGMEALDDGTESGIAAEMDGLADDDGDLTLDFGFVAAAGRLGVGNLVYLDANGDGFAHSGEGLDGVTVRLHAAGSDPASDAPVAETMTTGGGHYFFGDLDPGSYFVFVPATHFSSTEILARCLPLPVTAGTDDGAGQDALPTVAPDQTGVRTGNFTLAVGTAPMAAGFETGAGAAADDAQDAGVDLTVDLGFLRSQSMSVGNLVFVDANKNGSANSGEGWDGVTVHLFREGDDPATVSPQAELVTAVQGRFLFTGLAPGRYFMRVPAAQFQAGGALYGMQSITGAVGDDGGDDNDNGVDAPEPSVTGVRSVVFELTAGAEPVDAGSETGIGAEMDGFPEENGDMTLDFGFAVSCPLITIQPPVSEEAWRNVEFQHRFSAQGGTGPYTFALVGDLPPGLVFEEETGEIWGTPTELGEFTCYVGVLDAMGCNAALDVTLTVAEPLSNLAVGNTVFADLNGNGRYDAGEGISGVTVELVPQVEGAAVSSTVSGTDGHYLFENLPPGNYLLRVPAAMFAQGAPLDRMKSLPGVDGGFDDDVGEDGHDAENPAATGVVTDVLVLMPGLAPKADTGESGRGATADDASDAHVDLTRDFGFVSALPGSFQAWKSAVSLPQEEPQDDPDGDGIANMIEYALGSAADSGLVAPGAPELRWNAETNGFDFVFSRRLGGASDVTLSLEVMSSEGEGFSPVNDLPEVSNAGAGLEQVIFRAISQAAEVSGETHGFVRLRVAMDQDSNGTPDSWTVSPPWCWRRQTYAAGEPHAVVMPLVLPEVYAGPVQALSANTLQPTLAVGEDLTAKLLLGRSYYIEVISGAAEGGRWEVDEAATTSTVLAVDLAAALNTEPTLPDLSDAVVLLRPHMRLADLAVPQRFQANTRRSNADRVMRFEPGSGSFTEFWLYGTGAEGYWVLADDENLISQDAAIIAPGQGAFVQARSTPTSTGLAGRVRLNDFRLSLNAGSNLVGTGWPLNESLANIGATSAVGFRGSNRQGQADRFRLWERGLGTGASRYTGGYLFKTASVEKWVFDGDATLTDQSQTGLLFAFEAFFLTSATGITSWRQPAPEGIEFLAAP
jgi:hypothetical protein